MTGGASRGLVDLHCHVMPYVDDGAYDKEECLELLKMEAAQGVRTICLTPHLRADMFESTDEIVLEHFAQAEELVREAELPLKLYHSREYHFDRIFRKRMAAGELRPLGNSDFLLLEFGSWDRADEILEAVAMVRSARWRPLLAHAERYEPLQRDWRFARELCEAGAFLQVNAGSILGREGLRQRLLCRRLLQNQLVHVVASDAHDVSLRRPELGTCEQFLEKKYGEKTARLLLQSNPQAILQGSKEIVPCSK